MNAQQILEKKGWNASDVLQANDDNLDMQVRTKFGVENEPLHLWESYYIGDADEDNLLKAAKNNDCSDIDSLLSSMDAYLIELCENMKYADVEAYFKNELTDSDFNAYEDDEIELDEFTEGDNAGWKITIDDVTYYKALAHENSVDIEEDTYYTVFFNQEGDIEIV